MTETLLVIFEMRGFDRRDVTVLPESNNSIQQGGLSFYVIKDDTRKAGPWYDPSFKPKKRNPYEGRDLKCMDEPYAWQKKIMDILNEEADDRTINWVYNASGCAGKSKLMKYLPRVRGSDERQQELFSALEEIKNGWVESPMYGKAAELLMEPPHIWIFSNELPNVSMCSLDRWHVWHLYEVPDLSAQFNDLDPLAMVTIVSLPEDLQRMIWSHYIIRLRMRSFRRTLLKQLEQAYQTRYKGVPLYEGRLCPLAVAYTYDGRAGYTKRMGRLIQVHRFITSVRLRAHTTL